MCCNQILGLYQQLSSKVPHGNLLEFGELFMFYDCMEKGDFGKEQLYNMELLEERGLIEDAYGAF